MFTILTKRSKSEDFGVSTFDRYYRSWDKAKKVLNEEVEELVRDGAKVVSSLDYFNAAKGFYVYQKNLVLEIKGFKMKFMFALIDGYFQDEE